MPQKREEDTLQFPSDPILTHTLFLRRENSLSRLPYELESTFYDMVKNGDTEAVKENMLPLKNEKLGHLSDDPIRNLKYHLIITIALMTRFCMEGGMLPENAYTLSDIYIQKLDHCMTEKKINELHEQAVLDFTGKMKQLRKENVFSKAVTEAVDYVYGHLHEKIKLEEVSRAVSFNRTYFCSLFKKETGISFGQYVMRCKLEAAQNMLLYSGYSPLDISNYFAFSSHSYFIRCFKKEYGLTPKEYQVRNYRSHFTKK